MALGREHEIHQRRLGRNVGVGIVLACFAGLVFALTVVKVTNGDLMEGFDHSPRSSIVTGDQ